MTKAITLAAILLLCAFPFIIVAEALTGRSIVTTLTRRLGLDPKAAHDLSKLFEPAHATTSSLKATAYVFFIVGGICAVAAIQDLYEKAFGLEPKGLRNLPRQLAALAFIFGFAFLVATVVAPPAYHLGGVPLAAVAASIMYSIFWFVLLWLLLAGRLRWSTLLPSAIATGICTTGMYVVFHYVFSGDVTGDYNKYGAIGVVIALMSYFIAIGVVISIGAAFGIVWDERNAPDDSAEKNAKTQSRDPARLISAESECDAVLRESEAPR